MTLIAAASREARSREWHPPTTEVTKMKYEIVKVIAGYMVYRGRVPSQVYFSYRDAEALKSWLEDRDNNYSALRH